MGLFGRRSTKKTSASARQVPGDTSGGLADDALDTTATLVRDFGTYGFALGQDDHEGFVASCEAWARHALTGVPVERAEDAAADRALGGNGAERDWSGLRFFFRSRRREEQGYVDGTMRQFRSLVWDLVDGLRDLAAGGEHAGAEISASLERLRESAERDSLEELRGAVGTTIGAIQLCLERQREQHSEQLRTMGARLSAMREQLLDARRQMSLDPLTQLFNRGALDQGLAQYVTLSQLGGQQLLLMMVDLDHFKQVNDTHGHPAGDAVLRHTADQILRTFPRKNDFAARYGGEEFAVLLFDAGPGEAPRLADRLLRAIRGRPCRVGDASIRVTCSIGYSNVTPDDTPQSLLSRADEALYRAKKAGRDQAQRG